MKKILFFLLVNINLLVVAQVPAYVPTLGLVGWWPFTGNANDISGNGNNGINVGATLTTDRFSSPNSAYNFNGTSSHIKIPNNFFNSGWSAFTISLWLNTSHLTNPNNPNSSQIMFDTYPLGGVAMAFNWGNSSKYSVWTSSNPPLNNWDILFNGTSTSTVSLNTWDHLVLVKNGTNYYLYKNAVLDKTYNTAVTAQSYFSKAFFGSDDTTITNEYFWGKLDDYGIWNRALSPAEITQVYQACAPGAAPGAIAGNTAQCAFSGTTYSVAAVAGATSYSWTLPGGWTGTSTTNVISITPNGGSGTISVVATNSCGVSPPSSISINVITSPAAPAAITGNTTVCSGSTNTYSVAPVAGATSYSWSIPGGWTGTSTTNVINIVPNLSSGTVSVSAQNTCGNSTFTNLSINVVTSTPASPGAVAGNTMVCAGSSNVYSVALVAGANSYSWSLPGGWTGTSTTNIINAVSNVSSGNVSVSAVNVCGASGAANLAVNLVNVPSAPNPVAGNTAVCAGSSNSFSVSPVAGATSYVWNLPVGWTGTSTTNIINTTAGAATGTITVAASNFCGISPSSSVVVNITSAPVAPASISGNTLICNGTANIYTVPPVPGASSYTWTLPGGWAGIPSSNTINVLAGASSGTLTVIAGNACGTSPASSIQITVISSVPAVPGPIIGNTTVCSFFANVFGVSSVPGAISYSWTLPGGWSGVSSTNTISAMSGLNSGTIGVAAINSCGASQNSTLAVNVIECSTGLAPNNTIFNGILEVYPNPNSGNFFIDYKNSNEQLVVSVSNVLGQEIYHGILRAEFKSEISLPAVAGIYSLKLTNAENKIVLWKKVVID